MALCRLHLDAILDAFAHAIGANLGRPLTKGLAIRDLRQSLSQLRLAPDYIDVHGLRRRALPRRGRPARRLLPGPAAFRPRRDPRLHPGPQRPGRPRPSQRPLEDADAPRGRQRPGAGGRGPAPPGPQPRGAAGPAGRPGHRDSPPGGGGDPPDHSPAGRPHRPPGPGPARGSTWTTRWSSSSPRPTRASSPTSSAPSARSPRPCPARPFRRIRAPSPSTRPSPSRKPPPERPHAP